MMLGTGLSVCGRKERCMMPSRLKRPQLLMREREKERERERERERRERREERDSCWK
jgi:hypothetical protein